MVPKPERRTTVRTSGNEAGLRRIAFEQISFSQDTWGSLLTGGFPAADFRPIAEAESQEFVDLWNARSGRSPIQLVEF